MAKVISKRELARRLNISYSWIDCLIEREEFYPFTIYEGKSTVKKVEINNLLKKALKEYFEKKIMCGRTNVIKRDEFREMIENNFSCLDK